MSLEAPPPAQAPRIHVVHATAPGCSWSWGYEGAFTRLKLVYGDQIGIHVHIGCPYSDFDQWLKDYNMSMDEAIEWLNETTPTMGVPFPTTTKENIPWNVWPATLGALAAMRQGGELGWRYHRALLRMVMVEQQDPVQRDVLLAAAREARLDVARFERDLADEEGLQSDYENQGRDAPPVHVGFYNVVVTDGDRRRVILDHAWEPREIEEAIDFLAGGKLRKQEPTDVLAYLRAHGLTPLVEVRRVFAIDDAAALRAVEDLEKAGQAERVMLAGAPHWRATEGKA